MAENNSRSERQQLGIQRWREAKGKGTFQWATGMGKTYTALKVINLVRERKADAVVHIVVPTIFLQAQFHQALGRSNILNVDVYVINTYVREPRACDLLIADEVHLFLGEHAEQFPKLFTELCQHAWVLALSATLTEHEQETLSTLGIPVADTITLSEAQAAGWVAKCRTYNLGIELTEQERVAYNRHNDIFMSTFARFGHDFSLAMQCVADRFVRERYAKKMGWSETSTPDDRWNPKVLGAAANMWLRATHARQEVVNLAEGKLLAAEHLCRSIPVKTICFSESTSFASQLAERMPEIARAYHSKVPSTTEEYTITKSFKSKADELVKKTRRISGATVCGRALADFGSDDSPIRVISAAKALDQGADFAGLQLGIETSGNSSIRQKVQRTGRVVRADAIEDKLALYVHIYALNTYEENKLRRKQKGIKDIIWTTDINHITL
jgi:superfamily II DNA or RNA helicase